MIIFVVVMVIVVIVVIIIIIIIIIILTTVKKPVSTKTGTDFWYEHHANLYILNAVRCPYVHNCGRGQLSSESRQNENDDTMRTGATSAVGARRANDVMMRMRS